MIWAIFASLAAAALNASSSVLERLAVPNTKGAKILSRRQAIANFFSKGFLIGMTLQVLAFVMQALALAQAPIIVVAPLLTTDLLFLLLLMRFPLHVRMKSRDWLAALIMMGGMAGLFLIAQPVSGNLQYALAPWLLLSCIIAGLVIGSLWIVNSSRSPTFRGGIAAVAGALTFALNAAFTKLALNQLKEQGVATVFTSWPLYALVVSGIVSIYLLQTAYSTGPLAVTQPIMEVTEPAVGVAIGLFIFGDMVNHNPASLAFEVICAIIVMIGIVLLASSPQIHKAREKGM